jgi:hypothetical protein
MILSGDESDLDTEMDGDDEEGDEEDDGEGEDDEEEYPSENQKRYTKTSDDSSVPPSDRDNFDYSRVY